MHQRRDHNLEARLARALGAAFYLEYPDGALPGDDREFALKGDLVFQAKQVENVDSTKLGGKGFADPCAGRKRAVSGLMRSKMNVSGKILAIWDGSISNRLGARRSPRIAFQ
jgi:hypothetical protein